jgi:hypothetical protein
VNTSCFGAVAKQVAAVVVRSLAASRRQATTQYVFAPRLPWLMPSRVQFLTRGHMPNIETVIELAERLGMKWKNLSSGIILSTVLGLVCLFVLISSSVPIAGACAASAAIFAAKR